MIRLIEFIFQVLYFALFLRVILSWLPHHEDQPIISIIYKITDPLLKPFQDLIPPWRLGIDISPILAGIALALVKEIIFKLFF